MRSTRRRRGVDEIAVVESMYDLSSWFDDWLFNVSRNVISNLDADHGAMTVRFELGLDKSAHVRPLFVDTVPGRSMAFSTSSRRSSTTRR